MGGSVVCGGPTNPEFIVLCGNMPHVFLNKGHAVRTSVGVEI